MKRSRIEIIRDILKVSEYGAKKTKIMYRANMSFAQRNEYLSLLEERDLIENIEDNDGNVRYKTSKRGREFLKHMRNIDDLINK